jgi:hypothetical protein
MMEEKQKKKKKKKKKKIAWHNEASWWPQGKASDCQRLSSFHPYQ